MTQVREKSSAGIESQQKSVVNSTGFGCRTNAEKTDEFVAHFQNSFTPNKFSDDSSIGEIRKFLDIACHMELPNAEIDAVKVQEEIKILTNKSPGYDRINALTFKALLKNVIVMIVKLFIAMLRICYLFSQWKCAERYL